MKIYDMLINRALNGGGGGGGGSDTFPIFTTNASYEFVACDMTFADISLLVNRKGDYIDCLPFRAVNGGEFFWAVGRITSNPDELAGYEVPETVTSGFVVSNFLYADDNNFYQGGK